MEEWIYRIMTARNPDWRGLARAPMQAATGGPRATDTARRER